MSCRRSILAALRTRSSLEFEQVIYVVRTKRPWVSRSIIGRLLDILVEEGRVFVVDAPGAVIYALNKDGKISCPK